MSKLNNEICKEPNHTQINEISTEIINIPKLNTLYNYFPVRIIKGVQKKDIVKQKKMIQKKINKYFSK